jgi:hypothetical protein
MDITGFVNPAAKAGFGFTRICVMGCIGADASTSSFQSAAFSMP